MPFSEKGLSMISRPGVTPDICIVATCEWIDSMATSIRKFLAMLSFSSAILRTMSSGLGTGSGMFTLIKQSITRFLIGSWNSWRLS